MCNIRGRATATVAQSHISVVVAGVYEYKETTTLSLEVIPLAL